MSLSNIVLSKLLENTEIIFSKERCSINSNLAYLQSKEKSFLIAQESWGQYTYTSNMKGSERSSMDLHGVLNRLRLNFCTKGTNFM